MVVPEDGQPRAPARSQVALSPHPVPFLGRPPRTLAAFRVVTRLVRPPHPTPTRVPAEGRTRARLARAVRPDAGLVLVRVGGAPLVHLEAVLRVEAHARGAPVLGRLRPRGSPPPQTVGCVRPGQLEGVKALPLLVRA